MENTMSNSDIPASQEAAEEIFDSQDSFFDDLEQEVNGQVYDAPGPKAEPQVFNGPEMATQQTPQTENSQTQSTDWEKRYQDSSRVPPSMA